MGQHFTLGAQIMGQHAGCTAVAAYADERRWQWDISA